ncbi:hypothetical protein PMAYCL1PPCAC_27242, partial [Pristionchus mayeri]
QLVQRVPAVWVEECQSNRGRARHRHRQRYADGLGEVDEYRMRNEVVRWRKEGPGSLPVQRRGQHTQPERVPA